MKPLYLEVRLYEPVTKKEFPIFDGVEVDIVSTVNDLHRLKLIVDPHTKIFHVDKSNYRSRDSSIRVRFMKPNFSTHLGKLLSGSEISSDSLPIYYPSRVPYWDFDLKDLPTKTSIEHPFPLKIPLCQFYNIGHRGAPYYYPENTIASFRKALDLGANGLELDLCLTKDKKIVVFHDPKPVNLLSPINRINIENLPYSLISPKFVPKHDGLYPVLAKYQDDNYVEVPLKTPLRSIDEYDIVKLTLEQVRQIYRYRRMPNKDEHPIPDFEEFLSFVSREYGKKSNLQFLFFDVKNPGWDEKKDPKRFIEFGSLIGNILAKFPSLPEVLIIGHTHPNGLECLKLGIERTGEKRCEFAYDAPGSLAALVQSFPKGFLNHFLGNLLGKLMGSILGVFLDEILRKVLLYLTGRSYNPLKVTKAMKNTGVSIGCLGRPRNLEEIKEVIRDRDVNLKSLIKTIIHYTLNEPEQMGQSLRMGVNGVITDKPDEFRRILEEQGIGNTLVP